MKRFLSVFLLLACVLCGCAFCGCGPVAPSGNGSEIPASSVPSAPPEESSEEPLPSTEGIALLYEEYIVAGAERYGYSYLYTFCFGDDHTVFNAEAEIAFPDEKRAKDEYRQLALLEYPNLSLHGRLLKFAFPRKECPYYGIRFDVLPILLADTIYEIREVHPAPEDDPEP